MTLNSEFILSEPEREQIDNTQGPLVLEFGSPHCGHCMAAQPLVRSALSAHPAVRHLKVEDGKGRKLGRTFQVKLWPTLIFLRDGQETSRLVRPNNLTDIQQALGLIVQPA